MSSLPPDLVLLPCFLSPTLSPFPPMFLPQHFCRNRGENVDDESREAGKKGKKRAEAEVEASGGANQKEGQKECNISVAHRLITNSFFMSRHMRAHGHTHCFKWSDDMSYQSIDERVRSIFHGLPAAAAAAAIASSCRRASMNCLPKDPVSRAGQASCQNRR